MRGLFSRFERALAVTGIVLCSTLGALAQPARGAREMVIITSSPPGGGYDAYSRLLGRYLQKHLPGNPAFIVNNMPGGAGIRAANYLYNISPKDGSTIALLDRAVATAPLLYGEESKSQLDATRFSWIGSVMRETGMVVVSTRAAAKTIEDATKVDVIVGSTGPEQDTGMYPRLLNELVGTRFKIVYGYAGQPEIFHALEKNELEGLFMSGWSGNGRAYVREQMSRDQMRLLMQISATRDPLHADVPTILDVVTKPADREIVQLLLSRLALGRPFMAPPGIPANRLAELRAAFRASLEDPDLLTEAASMRLAIDPIWGDEAQAMIKQAYSADPGTIARVREVIRLAR